MFLHDAFSLHAPPEQIHLAVAAAGGVRVSWATKTRTRASVVRFSLNAHDFSDEARADAPCEQYDFCTYTSPWNHHVLISGEQLLPSTTYFCACCGRCITTNGCVYLVRRLSGSERAVYYVHRSMWRS